MTAVSMKQGMLGRDSRTPAVPPPDAAKQRLKPGLTSLNLARHQAAPGDHFE